LRGGRIIRLLLLSLPFLLSPLACHAQDSLSAAQKKYLKEMKALWSVLEITDSTMPAAVVGEDEAILPSFKLSNKTNRELPVPLALGFPSERGGVIGWPVWSFVSSDKRSKPPLTRKGVLAYAFKIDPNGHVLIDASKVAGMTAKEIGLAPGAYQMTVNFNPYASGVGGSMVSKPFKFVVKSSDDAKVGGEQAKKSRSGAAAVSSPKSGGGMSSAGQASPGSAPNLLEFVSFGKIEFASEAVQIGTPLNCTFDLIVDPVRPLPPDDPQSDAPKVRLNCGWKISKLGAQKSSNSKTRVSGSIINVSSTSLDQLRKNGTCTLKLLNETSGLPPGYYELAVWLWQEGGQVKQTKGDSKTATFRISK